MIKVASYAGDFERALAVLDDMETAGVAPTAAVWGSLLVACGKVWPLPPPAHVRGRSLSRKSHVSGCLHQHCEKLNALRLGDSGALLH